MKRWNWFLPPRLDLVGMLQAQVNVTVEGMDALVAWSNGEAGAGDRVRQCEHRADDAKRALWRALREAFSPPMDAEDLFALSSDLDEVLNGAKDIVREMEVMSVAPDSAMRDMSMQLRDSVSSLSGAFADLAGDGDPTGNADVAIRHVRQMERVYRAAMPVLLDRSDERDVVGMREAYRRLLSLGDSVRRVADRVWYATVKES
ncbi:MAG: DUF47 family protein [Acidimicrobiia bacterium]|nr:DUF47 family protein [Acidimicrobiia bacterium]